MMETTSTNLQTCSETIGFAKRLEAESASFYENLSERYPQEKEIFLSFVKENKRFSTQIERTYYSVITDAIEGCFAFNLNPSAYTFEVELPEQAGLADAVAMATEIEKKVIRFYTDAAEHSSSLMADVPRNFKLVSRKRENRIEKLTSLLRH